MESVQGPVLRSTPSQRGARASPRSFLAPPTAGVEKSNDWRARHRLASLFSGLAALCMAVKPQWMARFGKSPAMGSPRRRPTVALSLVRRKKLLPWKWATRNRGCFYLAVLNWGRLGFKGKHASRHQEKRDEHGDEAPAHTPLLLHTFLHGHVQYA